MVTLIASMWFNCKNANRLHKVVWQKESDACLPYKGGPKKATGGFVTFVDAVVDDALVASR